MKRKIDDDYMLTDTLPHAAKRHKNIRKHRYWIHPIFRKRKQFASYYHLIKELNLDDAQFTTTSAWIKHNLTQTKAKANIRETPFYVIIWNFPSGSRAFWSVLAYVCVCVLDVSLTERSGSFALYITQTQAKTDAITHTWRQLKRKQWTRFKQNGYKTQTQTQTETQTRTWRRHLNRIFALMSCFQIRWLTQRRAFLSPRSNRHKQSAASQGCWQFY